MSNLKLVAGTVKRRGIAIAAAVAVAGGSLATANYAMAVEADVTVENEFVGTDASNAAIGTLKEAADAIKTKKSEAEVEALLNKALEDAAVAGDAGFSKEDLANYDKEELNKELKDIAASGKQNWQKKMDHDFEQTDAPMAPAPQAPGPNPADWATPAPEGFYSPQRLEAEFGGTPEAKVAQETAEQLIEAFRRGATKQEAKKFVQDSFVKAGFTDNLSDEELNEFVEESYQRYGHATAALQFKKNLAKQDLAGLKNLNPLQREIFQKDIESADSVHKVNTVMGAARAENVNPVQQFAPVPGQKTPEEAGEKTDVEKALAHTKQEALKKLEGFTFLTQQQRDAYTKAVNEATQVYQVEAAFETGEAKNKVNEEAKKAQGFLDKAIARTKHLALEKLDGFDHLTHEQKREARNKIVAAKQVFEVEAAFHAAEKLNNAAK